MKTIALVGGAGFIGHNLAINLKENGYDPYIIDSLSVNNLYSNPHLSQRATANLAFA